MRSIKSCPFLAPCLAVLLLTWISTIAPAQTYKVLHTFTGAPKDGDGPVGTLLRDAAGNLYGVTQTGGAGTCGQSSCGTVFMLSKTGAELGVFSLSGQDGTSPAAGLLRDSAGNLYGTTQWGGIHNCGNNPPGCGTIFQLNKTGSKIRNYSFAGQPDGAVPESRLIEFSGSLYGTTAAGGTQGYGTIFSINAQGKETALYSFQGGADGCDPWPGVTADSQGNLYGVAFLGGSGIGACADNYGTAYKLDTAGHLTVLYTFGGSVGAYPASPLISDSQGNLYGAAESGGQGCDFIGCGTVFKLSRNNGTWSGRAVYAFCQLPGCTDGEQPAGQLVRDASGNLYGVTNYGGEYGWGTVFKLDTSGNETVLYSFTGGADGAYPSGGLIMDASGNLYGVALEGGNTSCDVQMGGCGVVFELTP